MKTRRIARHLLMTDSTVRRAFPRHVLDTIENAIKASESVHSGQVRFAVEGSLDGAPLFAGQSARERAIDVFSRLRVWDTEHNNGALIYLLLADRAIEIVADRGLNSVVSPAQWTEMVQRLSAALRAGNFEDGLTQALEEVSAVLVQHFPADGSNPNPNELDDRPVLN